MQEKLLKRFYDVLVSIYIYNEYVGYKELEQMLHFVEEHYPNETKFIQAIKKHYSDEKKHYQMFRAYFKKEKRMPFYLSPRFGYIDLFIQRIFKKSIRDLNRNDIIKNENSFFRLCRLIMLTEARGLKQVQQLLKNPLIRKHQQLTAIFRVVEVDEPSHFLPYREWLEEKGNHTISFSEKLSDLWIHYSILLFRFPYLYLNLFLKRRKQFYA